MADDRPDQEQFVIPNTSEITVEQIMRRDVPAIGPDDTVAYVAKTMVDHRLAGVPVVDDGEVIGIITESDIIQREADIDAPTPVPFLDAIFVADAGALYGDEVRRALAINARMLMSNPVTNIRQSATLSEVATVMIDRHLKVLPVLDDEERLVGIVTRAELVRVIAELENQAS